MKPLILYLVFQICFLQESYSAVIRHAKIPDVENSAPTDVLITNDIVYFTSGRQMVGVLRAVDPNASDNHTYFLDSNGSEIFEIIGDQLWIKESFNSYGCVSCDIPVAIHVSDGSDWETYGFEKVIYIKLENNEYYNKLVPGKQITNYRMISMPASIVNLDGLLWAKGPNLNNKNYGINSAVYEYQSLTGYQLLKESSSLISGEGYWVIVNAKYVQIGMSGTPDPVLINNRGEFELDLDQGWNLIGNPYREALDWDDELQYNVAEGYIFDGQVSRAITYDGAYNITASLDVLDGAFVYASSATTIYLRKKRYFDNAPSAQRISSIVTNANADWELEIELSGKNQRSNLGGIGMKEYASNGVDSKDFRVPPYLGSGFDFHLEDEHGLSRNIVSPSESYTWEYSLKTNTNALELSWDQSQTSSLGEELWMELLPQRHMVNMNETGNVKFIPNENQRIKIYYGHLPDRLIFEAYPNPAKDEITLKVFSMNGSNGTLEVWDLYGNRVWSQVVKLTPGQTVLKWDMKDGTSPKLQGGLYFFKLLTEDRGARTLKIVFDK